MDPPTNIVEGGVLAVGVHTAQDLPGEVLVQVPQAVRLATLKRHSTTSSPSAPAGM